MRFSSLYFKIVAFNKNRYYMAFFVSCLANTVVYTFSAIANSQVFQYFIENDNRFSSFMNGITIALAMFSVFLINYAFSSLSVERKKETDVIFSLGFNRSRMFGLLGTETVLIFFLTYGIGLLLGTVLSSLALFFMSWLFYGQTVVSIAVSMEAFLTVSILMAVTFLLVMIRCHLSTVGIGKAAASKEKRNLREPRMRDYFMCLSGLAVLVYTLVSLFKSTTEDVYDNFLRTMLLMVIGIFLIVQSLGGILIKIVKTKGNLLVLNHMRANYDNYAKLMAAMTILVVLTVYLVGLSYIYFDTQNEEEFLLDKPYDVTYDSTAANLQLLAGINQNDIAEKNVIQFAVASVFDNYRVDVISETDYYKLTGKMLNLESGSCHLVSQTPEEKYNWISLGENVEITVGNQKLSPVICEETWEYIYNRTENVHTFIFKDDDFHEIEKSQLAYKHLLRLHDWQSGEDVSLQDIHNPEIQNILTTYDQYRQEKAQNNSLFFFISLAVVIFLVSLGSLLHFKVSNDVLQVKELNSFFITLGVCEADIKKAIRNNYSLFFIIPTAIGIVYGSLFVSVFLGHVYYQIFVIAFIYVISQFAFYRYTMKKLILL